MKRTKIFILLQIIIAKLEVRDIHVLYSNVADAYETSVVDDNHEIIIIMYCGKYFDFNDVYSENMFHLWSYFIT